jgi:putative ABC transport system permease protein
MGGMGSQVLRGLLVGLSPRDPATFIAVPLFLVVVVVVVSYLPARRASRLDPARVLRS